MKSLVILALFLSLSSTALARDVKGNADPDIRVDFTGVFSIGYRAAGVKDGQELESKESKGSAYASSKIYILTADVSNQEDDQMLFLGIGYRYQFNGNHGMIFSPIAYKTPIGPSLSLDFFSDAPEKGAAFGLSLGFNLGN